MAVETFASAIKDGLQRVIVAQGYSICGVSKAMGRSNTWLTRKLAGARPLFVDDVDLVCTFLGIPALSVIEPVRSASGS